jgi:hypothetical protein
MKNLQIENKKEENKVNTNNIDKKIYMSNPLLFIPYPDFELFQRILLNPANNFINAPEGNLISQYAQECQSAINTPSSNIHRGCFYLCRKLGIITRYDKELFDSFNSSALFTLFFSLFSVKILTTSLIEGKYIKPKSEVKSYFVSILFILSGSFIYLYTKKKELDLHLDKKYDQVFKAIKASNIALDSATSAAAINKL